MVSMVNKLSAKPPATLAISDSQLHILISFNQSTKFNLMRKAVKPRLKVKVEGPEDDKKVKEVNHKG